LGRIARKKRGKREEFWKPRERMPNYIKRGTRWRPWRRLKENPWLDGVGNVTCN
jgi:hypothetical protein